MARNKGQARSIIPKGVKVYRDEGTNYLVVDHNQQGAWWIWENCREALAKSIQEGITNIANHKGTSKNTWNLHKDLIDGMVRQF